MNLSSGVAGAGVKAHGKSCPSATGRSGDFQLATFGLWTKNFTTSSGPHKVTVHWSVTWTAMVSAHPAPAVAFYPSAETYLTVLSYLYDSTNSTYLYPTNGWHSSNVTFNGNTTYHHSASVSIFFNQTLIASHAYSIRVWFAASVIIFVPDTGTSTADASLNVATLGNGAKLTSIVRT